MEQTIMWTLDLGVNSENKNNISPGASTIDVEMWDGATVYDIDCDGTADVLVRIADGVAFGDWREEILCTGYDYANLVILSSNIPTDYRFNTFAQDPAYRNDMTSKGYVLWMCF